jgi:chromosome segregation ATPase
MKLFGRGKKEEQEPKDNENAVIKEEEAQLEVKIKSHEEILKEQYENELSYLQKEIRDKTENLESISKKLASVKEEYDIAVSNLMSTKKEINQKRMEIETIQKDHEEILEKIGIIKGQLESANKQYDEKKAKLDQLEDADANLSEVKKNIAQSNEEYSTIRAQIEETQAILDQVKIKQQEAEVELQNTNSRLKNAREEFSRTQTQKQLQASNTTMAKKEIQFIENELSSIGSKKESKNVIEAASAVVASMNEKLRAAQKELDVVKRVLEKERKEHQETKHQLEELKKSNSKNQG